MNVRVLDLEEEVFLVDVEGSCMSTSSKKCHMFRRDGHLAGLGEGLGLIALLAVDRRQHPGADTSEFDASVEQIHRGVEGVLLFTRKTSIW